MRYMGDFSERLQKMRDEIHAEDSGVVIPLQVWWLVNPHIIRKIGQRGEISRPSVICVVNWKQFSAKPGQRRNEGGGSEAPSWTIHECRPNQKQWALLWMGPHRKQVLWETSMRRLLRAASHQHPNEQLCGVYLKQGYPWSHRQEKYPTYNENHIAFHSWCGKTGEATRDAWGRSRTEPAGRTTPSMRQTSGQHKRVHSIRARAQEGAKRGGNDEEMADAEEGWEEEDDVTMVESMTSIASTMPARTATGTAMATGNIIELEKQLGNAAPKVWSETTQLHQVRCMDYARALDGGGTDSWCGVASRTIQRKSRHQN